SVPLLVMSLLSMSFPLSQLGDPHAGRWRDLNHDLLAHCRRKCGRCPFTLAASRAYLPLQAGKGTQAPLARFPRDLRQSTNVPPRSSSILIRTISLYEVSALIPGSRARRASMATGLHAV